MIILILFLFVVGIIFIMQQSDSINMRSFYRNMEIAGDDYSKDKNDVVYCRKVMRILGASEKEIEKIFPKES